MRSDESSSSSCLEPEEDKRERVRVHKLRLVPKNGRESQETETSPLSSSFCERKERKVSEGERSPSFDLPPIIQKWLLSLVTNQIPSAGSHLQESSLLSRLTRRGPRLGLTNDSKQALPSDSIPGLGIPNLAKLITLHMSSIAKTSHSF